MSAKLDKFSLGKNLVLEMLVLVTSHYSKGSTYDVQKRANLHNIFII